MKQLRLANEVFLFIVIILTISKAWIVPALSKEIFWAFDLFVFILIPGIYFLYRRKCFTYPFTKSNVLVEKKTLFEAIFYFCVSYLIVVIFAVFGDIALRLISKYQLIPFLKPYYYYSSHIPSAPILKALVIIYFAITAGLIEELIYRGLLAEILANRNINSVLFFMTFSATLFALVHLGGGTSTIIQNFFIGFGLACVYAWTKDIRFPIAVHTIYDIRFFADFVVPK